MADDAARPHTGRVRPRRAARRAVAAVVLLTGALAVATSAVHGAAASPPPPAPRRYPVLPASVAHPGTILMALSSPVAATGARVVAAATRTSAADVGTLNAALASIGTTGVHRLFTNVPADQLDAARAKAEAATGAFVTDFTQVYRVDFDPAVNPDRKSTRLNSSH